MWFKFLLELDCEGVWFNEDNALRSVHSLKIITPGCAPVIIFKGWVHCVLLKLVTLLVYHNTIPRGAVPNSSSVTVTINCQHTKHIVIFSRFIEVTTHAFMNRLWVCMAWHWFLIHIWKLQISLSVFLDLPHVKTGWQLVRIHYFIELFPLCANQQQLKQTGKENK